MTVSEALGDLTSDAPRSLQSSSATGQIARFFNKFVGCSHVTGIGWAEHLVGVRKRLSSEGISENGFCPGLLCHDGRLTSRTLPNLACGGSGNLECRQGSGGAGQTPWRQQQTRTRWHGDFDHAAHCAGSHLPMIRSRRRAEIASIT